MSDTGSKDQLFNTRISKYLLLILYMIFFFFPLEQKLIIFLTVFINNCIFFCFFTILLHKLYPLFLQIQAEKYMPVFCTFCFRVIFIEGSEFAFFQENKNINIFLYRVILTSLNWKKSIEHKRVFFQDCIFLQREVLRNHH